uniref:Aminotransferase-like plant mobile domain-containing protein n=1 Tax=Ditylenchus dipsaci TaxID=166011 RepID=A0A915DS66_9BILA
MVNFGLSFQYFPNHDRQLSIPAKFTWLSQTFQARAFHKGHEYKRWDEMESWLYLCYWFFDGFCLPWLDASCEEELGDTTERQICNFKDLFFVGAYDQDMSQYSRRYLPTSLRTMRNKVNFDLICGDRSMINYPFYARAIMEMVNEIKVDWSAPYQWQLEQEDLKPVESFIKHGSHLEGNVCIACENSLLAKQALNEAWKPSEPKIEKNKKSTKKKKPIVEDSESDSSTSSKQVKNNSSVDTNEID